MRLAVVQETRRGTATRDSVTLLELLVNACSRGAEVVVLPNLPWLSATEIAEIASAAFLRTEYPNVTVLAPLFGPPEPSSGAPLARGVPVNESALGTTAALSGDECLDPLIARGLAAAAPNAIILRPGNESDLQAEAMLERALGLSESISGLVLVAECDGGADGEPGHGGSAIVVLGEVVAEAVGGDDVLVAEVNAPMARPDARIPVPDLPPILAQRWAFHHGERASVDYPADLT